MDTVPVTARRRGRPARRRPLGAVELAEAAAFGDLTALVAVFTKLVPMGFVGTLLAAFPLAVVGLRRRLRATVAASVSAVVIAFLAGGPRAAFGAGGAAALGALVGIGSRRGWSGPRTALTAVVALALPASVVLDGLLLLLADYRELALEQVTNGARGLGRLVPALADPLLSVASVVTTWWWLVLPASTAVSAFLGTGLATAVHRRPLAAVAPLLPRDTVGELEELRRDPGPVAPLPLRLRGVGVRHPGAEHHALAGADLALDAGDVVTVTGPNGAGKSTLARVVAGGPVTDGVVERPGVAGLGEPGGTAMVFQRPESQVLGVRVGDDVRWGAPPDRPVDVDALLARVGLAGSADRETATLSGGELQRLAVAALLARAPAVVISDEATSMLDPDGRDEVAALLHRLADDGATALVQISHRPEERAGEVVALTPARAVPEADGEADEPAEEAAVDASARTPTTPGRGRRGGHVRLRGVDVVHDAGTPWRRPALHDVDLDLPAGTTVLVTGPNGAGKSTLARLLAGLDTPTRGTVTLDDAPLRNGREGALLGVQHARAGLLAGTVADDVRDAAGLGGPGADAGHADAGDADAGDADRGNPDAGDPDATVDAVLAALGLDPGRYRDRAVDGLSGGEQRRVLLAGLLAAAPRVLVLDEPLAGLDAPAVAAVRAALTAVRSAGTTLVITTHDAAALADLADATLEVVDGRVTGPPELVGVTTGEPRGETGERRAGGRTALRTLPGTSVAHRAPAGLKVAVLAALGIAVAVSPTWWAVLADVVVLAAWAAAGRVPASAVPRPPLWLAVWLLIGLVAALGGGPPFVEVGGVTLGLGGLESAARLLATALVTVVGAVLLVWTTPLGDVPPLLRRIARATRWTRLPVGEWAVSVALGLRMAPLLLDEGRTVRLVMRQRRRTHGRGRRRDETRRAVHRLEGAAALVCATAARRATETGEAVAARGGVDAALR